MALLSRGRRPLPVGWGIVGTGSIAHAFASDLAENDDPHVTAVCSRSPERARAFALGHSGATRTGKLRSVKPYTDLEQMLADPVVEMIYVATLNTTHREVVLEALRAGKPVLCEKPLATNSKDALQMAREARRRDVLLMEAVWTRHLPAVRAARDLLERGAIGRLVAVRGDLSVPRPFETSSRLFDPDQGGGALLDLGVYPLSLAIMFAGVPDEVDGRWWRNPAGTDSRAEVNLTCGLGDGAVDVRLACGFTVRNENRFVLQGTKGALVLDKTLGPTKLTVHDKPLNPLPEASSPADPVDTVMGWIPGLSSGRTQSYPFEGHGLLPQALRLAVCVRDGVAECPDMPLDDSIAALNVIDEILSRSPAGTV